MVRIFIFCVKLLAGKVHGADLVGDDETVLADVDFDLAGLQAKLCADGVILHEKDLKD